MISDPDTAFVWIWLPDHTDPVVCGRLDQQPGAIGFTYAASYLGRSDAVPIYHPELPLVRGPQLPASALTDGVPLCIADSLPDAWGRRLVQRRLGAPHDEFGDITYLLESGSDRIGALDFQPSATDYEPRGLAPASLEQLAEVADVVATGGDLPPALEEPLLHGTSIGGARPKAVLRDGDRSFIAKFSLAADTYPVVQAEFVAMRLASLAGLSVAEVALTRSLDRWTLLVERFDRTPNGHRRRMVSALTLLGLSAFPEGRYASYAALTHRIRADFDDPTAEMHELFGRVVFNMMCGNNDDHAKNHSAFINDDGSFSLTPAYDLCPQPRTGSHPGELAMAYDEMGTRATRLAALIDASGLYRLDPAAARSIIENTRETIEDNWDMVCNEAHLTQAERDGFWGRQFLNPAIWD